jgi:hypothetical protein
MEDNQIIQLHSRLGNRYNINAFLFFAFPQNYFQETLMQGH